MCKDKKYWQKNTCKNCEEEFWVRKCYVKRGQGKFCSVSCSTTYRNLVNNPTDDPEVREKISKNHANVSGKNNPMYGKTGAEAPSYIDGRSKMKGDNTRNFALINKENKCEYCGETSRNKLNVHHKNNNRKDNNLKNLQILCASCHQNIAHKRKRDAMGRFVKEGSDK